MGAACADPRGWVSAGVGAVLVVVFWLLGRRVVRSCLVSRPDGRNEGVTATRRRSAYGSGGRRVRCNTGEHKQTPDHFSIQRPYRSPASHSHTHFCTCSPYSTATLHHLTACLTLLTRSRTPTSSSITSTLLGAPVCS
jgi:hypothetical protein